MNNAINFIKEDLKRHKVSVTLPGEKEEKSLYLMLVTAKTSKLEDIRKTYGNKATTTHLKIARKIFKDDETENVYGVIVDDDLQMVFAFNRDFADYDSKKKIIVFRDIDDVLLDRIEAKEVEEFPTPLPPFPRLRNRRGIELFPDGGGGLIKYSLAEKETGDIDI